ncbi:MAG: NOB1 family endonuclease [Candidatus Thorarchaeota archaeon]
MPKVYILDTGALLSTWTSKHPRDTFVTTPGIASELRNRPSKSRLAALSILSRLSEEEPPLDAIAEVRSAAEKTGDFSVLSQTDIEIVALAQSKKTAGIDSTLVSSDLAVLNTARHMGIKILDPTGRFRKQIMWVLVCPGCGYRSSSGKGRQECPVCGTPLRRKPRNSR